jgi:hypothetical protein
MQDLRLIGVHEDGQHLLLADSEGNRFRVPLDEPLRAAVRRDRPRLGQLQIEMDGSMRPREVQALIRAGASAEEVAERSGWSVEKVRRYEGPILAEREHVAGLARGVRLRGKGGSQGGAPTLAARVAQRLSGRGVDPGLAEWDSARDDEGAWSVVVTFPAGGRERQARWHFDVAAKTVTAADDEARWLSEDDSSGTGSPIPAPHLVSTPVRATTVYDVEAEGGVAASARRKQADSPTRPPQEPVDLMSAMRERASARRRGGRRKTAPAHTPVDEAPRDDAMPLADLAYDPETMPPPPGARGPHPADAEHGHDAEQEHEHPSAPEAPHDLTDQAGTDDTDDTDTGADVLPARPPAVDVTDHELDDQLDDDLEAGDHDEPAADDEPTPAAPAPQRSTRRNGRPSVPSWDDVMFGARPRD